MEASVKIIPQVSREHNFVKLTREDVPKIWTLVSNSIEASLPPHAQENELGGILAKILAGGIDLWAFMRTDDDDIRVAALMTSGVVVEPLTGQRLYYIYSFAGAEYLSDAHYDEMIIATAEWARSLGCTRFATISSNARVLKILESHGADISSHYAVMDIGEI